MPNVQQVLNAEIRRLARKEVNSMLTEIAKKIAALRKENSALTQRIKALEMNLPKPEIEETPEQKPSETMEQPVSFYGEKLKKIREKLELTQAEFAKLIDVSAFSVCSWENGKNEPRKELKQRIASIQHMGKRELKKLKVEKEIKTDPALIPGKIRAFRTEYQLSLKGFADLAGIAIRSAFLWEQGKAVPRGGSEEKLYAVLNLPKENVEALLAGKGIRRSKRTITAEKQSAEEQK